MFFTMAHMIVIALLILSVVGVWGFYQKKLGNKLCICLSVLLIWFAAFAVQISPLFVPSYEYVKITATGEKNPIATVNEISVLGFDYGGQWNELTEPVDGRWAWYPGAEGADYHYAGWFPGAKDLQPEDATDYIVFRVKPGAQRSVVFLTNQWYGIAEVEFLGQIQRVDTYGNGEVKGVSIPDTTAAFYAQEQIFQLPVGILVYSVLCIFLCIAIQLLSTDGRKGKIEKYTFLFQELVKRDFTLKYKRTILGIFWSVLSPMCTFLIMWIVFKDILGSNIDHFAIYMFTGQLVYAFFNDATTQGMTSLLDNASIFTKVNMPKYLFLMSKNVSSLINFGLTLLVLFVFILIDGLILTPNYLLLLFPICCLILFNIGLGLILSALFVFFRDMQYLWGIFSQLIMWVSAIFYSTSTFDASMQKLFLINPLFAFITYFRTVIIDGTVPQLSYHLIILCYTILSLLAGAYVYKKYNHEFLYYV